MNGAAAVPPTALVTGASRGIGRGVALALADVGYWVAVNFVNNQRAADQVVADAGVHGPDAIAVRADISQPEDRAHLVEEVYARFGRLDLLVNNAGVAPTVRSAVGQRRVQDRPVTRPQQEGLKAHLAGRIVEPVGAHRLDLRLATGPGPARQPGGQQLELGRSQCRLVEQSHAAGCKPPRSTERRWLVGQEQMYRLIAATTAAA